MGTTGGKNFLEKFFGTTTESIIKKGFCPVIAIPERAPLDLIENIVYASDLENEEEITIMQLLQVKKLFKAPITILHVKCISQPDLVVNETIKNNLVKCYSAEEFIFVEKEDIDVAEGLTRYVQEHNISMLAFSVLHRNFWENMFHNSVTSKLLHELNLPMLALPKQGWLLDLRSPQPAQPDHNNSPRSYLGWFPRQL
jgi:nucleotide-binding universal stress UspA family protein